MRLFRRIVARMAARAAADPRSPVYEEDRPQRFGCRVSAAALFVIGLLLLLAMASCLNLFALVGSE